MELTDYLLILRKRWRLVLACLLVGTIAAASVAVLETPKYRATAQLFVSATDTGGLASALQEGAQFSEDRVQSYADIIDSRRITDAVASRLNIGLSGSRISKEVKATAPANTVLINVSVTDTSASRAAQLANAVSDEFANFVTSLEATQSHATPPVKITVVKEATTPASPVSPKLPLDIGIGVAVGLIVGLAGAVLRETLDNTIKTPDDVQKATGRSAIGVIAFDPGAKDRPLVVIEGLQGTRAEAFRQLRTNLQFVDIDTPLRSIVCTSSVPGEGKTTTICNLAITLAHTGMRVLLMEADLRRPRVGLYMGIDNSVGLTSVLIGAVEFDEAVQRWGPEGLLDVMPSGPTPPNPSELLGSRGMADLLHSLEQRYDIVLLDAPPLLPVTDAAVLAVETTGAVMVVHHGKTRREQLEHSAQALEAVGARILGGVLNFAPAKGPEAYYYGYAYSYRNQTKAAESALQPARTTTLARPEPALPPDGRDSPSSSQDEQAANPVSVAAASPSSNDNRDAESRPESAAASTLPSEPSPHSEQAPGRSIPLGPPASAGGQSPGLTAHWETQNPSSNGLTPPLSPYPAPHPEAGEGGDGGRSVG